MMDLKDLTNICVKVSQKWMNIIAFMIIHPILKKRNRGLAQKFEENGWSCDDANFILALLENQEKLSKVHDQMMMKASGFDWAMMVLSSRRSDRQRQCLAKVMCGSCNIFYLFIKGMKILPYALFIFQREIFFHRIDSDIVDQIVSFLCDEEPEDKKDIAKNNLKMVLSSRKADSQRQCFVKVLLKS